MNYPQNSKSMMVRVSELAALRSLADVVGLYREASNKANEPRITNAELMRRIEAKNKTEQNMFEALERWENTNIND